MTKKLLSWVLFVVMLWAMTPVIPSPASAATGAGVKLELVSAGERTADSAEIFKLVFSAKTPTTIEAFNAVFSYDKNMIAPTLSSASHADFTGVGDNSQAAAVLNQPFAVLLQASVQGAPAGLFTVEKTLWQETTNREAFAVTLHKSSDKADTNGSYLGLFEFYFRFKTGYTKADITADTFKFGDFTDGATTVFDQFFPKSTSIRYGIELSANLQNTPKVQYYWGYQNQTAYPNSIDEIVYPEVTSDGNGSNTGNTGGGGGGGGGAATTTATTLPAGDGTVAIAYTKYGTTVTLDLPTAKINEVIAKAEGGVATFDVSKVTDTTSVAMPKAALAKIAGAGLGAAIKFPRATMTLDPDAVDSIAAQTSGSSVNVEYKQLKVADLSPAQREAVRGSDVIVEINITNGAQKITSFDGKLTVSVPYSGPTPAAVWYLNDLGELEKIPCQYDSATRTVTFTVNHLSVFIVGLADGAEADAENEANATPPETSPPEAPFRDVTGADWFYNAVMWAYTNNLMNGTAADIFSPNASLTRGMVVTVLYRQTGSPAVAGGVPFEDVAAGMYYSDAVNWAAASGIVSGYGDGRFGPENDVTREQMAAILNNFVNYQGLDLRETRQIVIFEDDAAIAAYAKDAVGRLVRAGVITGKPGNLFDPQGNATRAEYATMLMRFLGTN